ncbi:MAG TPA: hypothetical protein VFM37_04140, partial [Pseudonocardiaceae bacterium]|nr:hypothetical protein [Pseudonocardiaceae bacterium]
VLELLDRVPQPEMVFLLDVSPEVAASRKRAVKPLELGPVGAAKRDFVSYQATVRRLLLEMAGRFGWPVVSTAARTCDDVATEVADSVQARLRSLAVDEREHA